MTPVILESNRALHVYFQEGQICNWKIVELYNACFQKEQICNWEINEAWLELKWKNDAIYGIFHRKIWWENQLGLFH